MGQYPALINMDGMVSWPVGVGPDEIMKKQQDLDMPERLKP